MDGGRLLTELDSLVHDQLEAARALRDALEGEHTSLERRDAEALARASADKSRAIARLETLEQQRRTLCGRIGAGPGHAELAAWLDSFSDGSDRARRLRERIDALTTLLRNCRAANEANGIVVGGLHRRVQQALGILRGGSPEPSTYGPAGLPVGTFAGRASLRA
jgi:flagellar biosynthesis/type III secretory pathway chaperone